MSEYVILINSNGVTFAKKAVGTSLKEVTLINNKLRKFLEFIICVIFLLYILAINVK